MDIITKANTRKEGIVQKIDSLINTETCNRNQVEIEIGE